MYFLYRGEKDARNTSYHYNYNDISSASFVMWILSQYLHVPRNHLIIRYMKYFQSFGFLKHYVLRD